MFTPNVVLGWFFRATRSPKRTRVRSLSMSKRLTFETIEQRCLLSCPPWDQGGGGAPPIPDPPESGDYTRDGVTIEWTCIRPGATTVQFTGAGSSSDPDTADPTFTLTVIASVTEDWSFVDPAWTRTARSGSLNQCLTKDEPNWYEQTCDVFGISGESEAQQSRHHALDKTESVNGQLVDSFEDWTEYFAPPEPGPIRKVGIQSKLGVPENLSPPVNGSLSSALERFTWSGPIQYTLYELFTNTTTYVNGLQNHASVDNQTQKRTFANDSDTRPTNVESEFYRARTNWFPSGNVASFNSELKLTNTDIPTQVTWTDVKGHQRVWFDVPEKIVEDHRAETISKTENGVENDLFIFERDTEYSSPATPSSFHFLILDFVTPANDVHLDLTWNNTGNLAEWKLDGLVQQFPQNASEWNFLADQYGTSKNKEISQYGNVPVGAYPDLNSPIY